MEFICLAQKTERGPVTSSKFHWIAWFEARESRAPRQLNTIQAIWWTCTSKLIVKCSHVQAVTVSKRYSTLAPMGWSKIQRRSPGTPVYTQAQQTRGMHHRNWWHDNPHTYTKEFCLGFGATEQSITYYGPHRMMACPRESPWPSSCMPRRCMEGTKQLVSLLWWWQWWIQ